jgi:hypothetical protein
MPKAILVPYPYHAGKPKQDKPLIRWALSCL